jgi:N-hydroxyarylamine O-acetyltransferase
VTQVTEDPWQVGLLDLDAYLAKVGVVERPPSREALDELHEAHVRTFTFDNIDVLLGTHPGVALEDVQAKFVTRGRGGYCFEHGTLFAAVLERLGYDVQRFLGRVGSPTRSPRTHCVVVVSLDDERLLADPGFGMSVLRPIPLHDGAEDDHRGWRHQVRRTDPAVAGSGWELYRLRESGWEFMHATDELPVQPVDVLMGHHYTSTFPASHFRHGLMLTRHSADGEMDVRHTAVSTDAVTVRRPGEPTEHHDLRDGELEQLLDELAVPLTSEERTRLLDVVAGLRRSG